MEFLHVLAAVVLPLLRLMALAGASYALFRFRILPFAFHRMLSKFVLYAALPALLFAKLAQTSDRSDLGAWAWLPLCAVAIVAVGGALGFLASRTLPDQGRDRALCTVLCAFQNASYLPLPIVWGVFPDHPDLDVLVMIFLIGLSPLLWSIGPAVFAGKRGQGLRLDKMLNPPILAILAGAAAMFLGLGEFLRSIPVGDYTLNDLTLRPLELLGRTSVYLVLIVLGGQLARIDPGRAGHRRLAATVVLTKLVALPVLGLLVVPHLGFGTAITIVLAVETMQPTALNVTIQAKEFAPPEVEPVVSKVLFWEYLVSAGTITVFLTILKLLIA